MRAADSRPYGRHEGAVFIPFYRSAKILFSSAMKLLISLNCR